MYFETRNPEILNMIYLLTAIGLSPGGSSTVHIYTQTIHRTTQNKQHIEQHNNLGECGPCPVLTSYIAHKKTHTHIQANTYTPYTNTYTHMHTPHTHTYIHTYIHTYTHTYTHTHTQITERRVYCGGKMHDLSTCPKFESDIFVVFLSPSK